MQSDQIDLAHEPAFRLGNLEIRPATREAATADKREVLEPRIMQVLVALARRREEVVSRDELIAACWSGRAVGDDAINRCIGRIRRLAETHGGFSLETIARVGYRLSEATGVPQATLDSGGEAPVSFWRMIPRWAVLTAVAVAVLVTGSGMTAWILSSMGKTAATEKVLVVRPPAAVSIAVLPFTPLYEDPEAQRLGDSIALRVADMLATSPFDVVSPTKSLQYRGVAKARAAQALGADFLIDGDLRRENDLMKVSMRIVDGRSGTTIVAGSINGTSAGETELPDEVAGQMAGFMWAARGLSPAAARDVRVLAGYFKATFLYGSRNDAYGANETARDIAKAAPGNALAHWLHGLMAAYLAASLPDNLRPAVIAEAREAAGRALQLEPGYGDSYTIFALTTPAYDWSTREAYLRQGLAVFPDSQNATVQLIELLQNVGRFRESSPMAESLLARSSYQVRTLIEVINARLWLGQVKDAQPLIERGRKLFPKVPWFAAKQFEVTAFHGVPAEAEALLRSRSAASLLEPGGAPKSYSLVAAALRYRRSADIDAVAADCAKIEGRSAEIKRTCFMALVALGRLDDAFRLAHVIYPDLRATPAAHGKSWLSTDTTPTAYLAIPLTAPLRADSRYREVVERVGLLRYWISSRHPPDFCATEKAPVCALLKS